MIDLINNAPVGLSKYVLDKNGSEWNRKYVDCFIDMGILDQVYYYGYFKSVSSEKYSEYHDCLYLQTYGGGPEGGWLVRANKNGERPIVYSCKRDWGTSWTIEPYSMGTKELIFCIVVNPTNLEDVYCAVIANQEDFNRRLWE